jgi:hypothetical protein
MASRTPRGMDRKLGPQAGTASWDRKLGPQLGRSREP